MTRSWLIARITLEVILSILQITTLTIRYIYDNERQKQE
jgi:hypothetical protein